MTWPPQGSNQDPYQQPYGQYPPADPYAQQQYPPAQPYGQPTSGQPYSPGPYSGQEYPASPAAGGYQQGGYQQPYAAYQQPKGTNTMAILAIVFAFVFSPLGIVFGHIGRKQIRERGEQGDGLALAGMIIGYVATGLYLIGCCVWLIFVIGLFGSAAATSGSGY